MGQTEDKRIVMRIDWEHVYLLAWWDEKGKSYLTTWDWNRPYVHVVVTGLDGWHMPLWKHPDVPSGAQLHLVPDEVSNFQHRLEYAALRGGYLALGWYIEEGFERESVRIPV